MTLQTSSDNLQTGCTLEGGSGGELWCQKPGPSHLSSVHLTDVNKSQNLNQTEMDLPLSELTVSCGQATVHIAIWLTMFSFGRKPGERRQM